MTQFERKDIEKKLIIGKFDRTDDFVKALYEFLLKEEFLLSKNVNE